MQVIFTHMETNSITPTVVFDCDPTSAVYLLDSLCAFHSGERVQISVVSRSDHRADFSGLADQCNVNNMVSSTMNEIGG